MDYCIALSVPRISPLQQPRRGLKHPQTLHLVMKYGHNKNSICIYRFHGLCSAVLESRQSLANNATANASVLFAHQLYIFSTRFPPSYTFPTLNPSLFIHTGIQYHHVGTMGAFGL
jgi:hypothetical protein